MLPGATVTATHPASGTVVERVTDGEGRFFLPALRIGQWEVTATMSRLRAPDEGDRPRNRAHAERRVLARVEGLSEQVTVAVDRTASADRPTRRSATSSGTAKSSRCR